MSAAPRKEMSAEDLEERQAYLEQVMEEFNADREGGAPFTTFWNKVLQAVPAFFSNRFFCR